MLMNYPAIHIMLIGERINELVVRSCPFTDLTVTPDGVNIYAVGTDR